MNRKTPFIRQPIQRLSISQFALFACLLSYANHLFASVTTPSELIGATQSFLEQTVNEYLQRSGIQGRYEIQVNNLDPRLRLSACDDVLKVTLENTEQPIGRVTTRVRCEGSSPWTVFVPAHVRLFLPVVIANKPLQRNQLLHPGDVQLSERDISQLNRSYFTDLAQTQDLKIIRPVQANQILTQSHVTAKEAIRKGDQVVISARSGTISVKMPGEALSDGSIGQQIRVRNTRSQRIIQARVIGPGQVEVQM